MSDPGEVIEAEIVHPGGSHGGRRDPGTIVGGWRLLALRMALAAAAGLLGILSLAAGLVLTLTIIAAPLGLTLLALGAGLCVVAVSLLPGIGRMGFVSFKGDGR